MVTRVLAALAVLPLVAAAPLPAPGQADAIFVDIPRDGPGCAASAIRGGKSIWANGYGMADIARGERITPRTIFNIASISKQFTAFSVLQLAAAGKLSLDDSIRKYIPEFGSYAQPVTIRHLLHHSGGLTDYTTLAILGGVHIPDKLTEADGLAIVTRQTQSDFAPGSRYVYSNTGYFMLGVIVERVSGQTMKAYAQQHIFAPLGMTDTSYVDAYPVTMARFARGYAPDGKGWKLDESGWEMTGDGQVHTTVLDLAKWQDNYVTGKVGGKALMRRMLEQGRLNDGEQTDYAMGLFIGTRAGRPMIYHSGGWAAYGAFIARFPDSGSSFVVLCNGASGARERVRSLADLFLGKAPPEGDAAQVPSWLKRGDTIDQARVQSGIYASAEGGVYEIAREGTGLVSKAPRRTGPIVSAGDGLYTTQPGDGFRIAFRSPDSFQTDEGPDVYRLQTGWAPADPASYAGRYYNADARSTLDIVRAADGGLSMTLFDQPAQLRPIADGVFQAGGLAIIDVRQPGGFTLRATGLRPLRFVRMP